MGTCALGKGANDVVTRWNTPSSMMQAGLPGLKLNSPVVGMLIHRITRLLRSTGEGEGIFLDRRVRGGGRATRDLGLLLHLGPHLDWDSIKGALLCQPLGAAWKDILSGPSLRTSSFIAPSPQSQSQASSAGAS